MALYTFHLGHQPHISIAEIQAVFDAYAWDIHIHTSNDELAVIESSSPFDAHKLQNILGGTTKISERLDIEEDVVKGLVNHLHHLIPDGKIQFSLSGKHSKQRALAVKKGLKEKGRSVRYVEPKNAATTLYNGLVDRQTDFTIYHGSVWVTRTIQDFEAFRERDYNRPAIDDKSGMLPPKLARILINLAGKQAHSSILYDPFCGSGTLLLEGLSLGCKEVFGSDISPKAISDSNENIAWFKVGNDLSTPTETEVHDMNQEIRFIENARVDIVATEPYMGKPLTGNESEEALLSQANELAELYVHAFANLSPILSSDATVIFIVPQFKKGNKWILIPCIEHIKRLGYTIIPFSEERPELLYHRPEQHLGRSIWKLKKTS